MSKLYNRAGHACTTTGTGTVTLGAALGAVAPNTCSYQTFGTAGAADGDVVSYLILDANGAWEYGTGTYTAAGTTLSRTLGQSSTGSLLNLSASSQVFITLRREDLISAPIRPQGRLTLQTVTPVMTTTQSAKTTVFYTPYVGQIVPLYDGSSFQNYDTGGELSQATTDSTKSPAAVTTNSNYDVFVWSDAGTMRATRGPAWTSDTGRGTGAGTTELLLQNGVYLNKIAITNGPAASRGTYVGTIRSNGSSQIDWIFGASAVGGTAGFLGVWNCYNRVNVATQVSDSTSAYAYATTTMRQADASAGMQVSYIYGLNEDNVEATYHTNVTGFSNTVGCQTGIGVDSTTVVSGASCTAANSNATPNFPMVSRYSGYPGLGLHKLCALEKGIASAVFNTTTNMATGLIANFRM